MLKAYKCKIGAKIKCRIKNKIVQKKPKTYTMLGFKDATNFERNNQSVSIIRDMLNKTDLELDEFWELCVTF